MKIYFEYIRWYSTSILCAVIFILALEGKLDSLQLLFGLLVLAAFVYGHGYKLDYKSGKKNGFILFYIVPFTIVVSSVVLRVFNLLN